MIQIPQYLGHFINGWPTKGVFTSGGLEFVMRPDDITEGFAVIAQRGAGKSNTAGVMEEIFATMGDQWIAIDPAAAHIGIRNARTKDGRPKGPSGLPVLIVGGEKGDFPLNPKGGKELAQILMETKISCVIDLKNTTTADKKHFLTDLGSELLAKNKTPLHLFLDEADEIIPQQPDNKEEQEIRAVWRKVIKRGRSSGLGFTILSQRAAMVDKTSLYQIQNLIVMQLSGAGDLNMIKGWFKHNTYSNEHMGEILTAMTSLKTGEAFLLSPKVFGGVYRIQIRERVTFHAGRTPKRGEQPIDVKQYEIKEIASLFQSKLEEKKVAVADERDRFTKLNQRVSELTALLTEAQKVKPNVAKRDPEAEAKKIQAAVKSAVAKRDRDWSARVAEFMRYLDTFLREATGTFATNLKVNRPQLQSPVSSAEDVATDEVRQQKALEPIPQKPNPIRSSFPRAALTPLDPGWKEQTPPVDGEVKLDGPQQRVVNAIAWLNSIGVDQPLNGAVSFLAGYAVDGGGYKNPRSALKTKGLIEYRGDSIVLTEEGRRLAVVPGTALTTEELHQRVFAALPGPESKILRTAIDVYPESITDEESGRLTNYSHTGGGFKNPRSRLKTLGLIHYPEKGKIKASDFLFLN